jgi:ABC-type Mn2+/Zn2+ transport system ATPase subunit
MVPTLREIVHATNNLQRWRAKITNSQEQKVMKILEFLEMDYYRNREVLPVLSSLRR